MHIGNLVIGNTSFPRIAGSVRRESLLSYSLGMLNTIHDTIELWMPGDICGLVVKIDKDISGYGHTLVQVLLEKKQVWFFFKDLSVMK